MKKALVLLADGFEEIEAVSPIDYLRRAGINVKIVSCGEGRLRTGSHSIAIHTDISVKDALTEAEVDAVIIPGGMPGAANIAACAEAAELITRLHAEGKIIAAICAAPVVVLAGLGLLAGRAFTCYPGIDADMARWAGLDCEERTRGAIKKADRVVMDGTLITGCGPGAAEEFSLAIAQTLAPDKAAELARAACTRSDTLG